MSEPAVSYRGHRFPAEVISHAVWLYYRFSLSFRDVEDLLAERGTEVSYETIRQWCRKNTLALMMPHQVTGGVHPIRARNAPQCGRMHRARADRAWPGLKPWALAVRGGGLLYAGQDGEPRRLRVVVIRVSSGTADAQPAAELQQELRGLRPLLLCAGQGGVSRRFGVVVNGGTWIRTTDVQPTADLEGRDFLGDFHAVFS